MDNEQEDVYTCPSFSSYSSNRLAEIAIRVAAGSSNDAVQNSDDDEDFQFTLVREDKEVLTEEFAWEGRQFRTVYPVFNRDLLLNNDDDEELSGENKQLESSIRVPLSKLFIEDRDGDNPASCSSSEASEPENNNNIPAGTYCVWRPKVAHHQPSPSQCKKSNSTGSASKRWKFRDVLRSNSEGKDNFVFLTPNSRREDKFAVQAPRKAKGNGVGGGGGAPRAPSAHEEMYVQKRAIKEGNKNKSYLPYKRDLVGFFVNVNGSSKSFPRF